MAVVSTKLMAAIAEYRAAGNQLQHLASKAGMSLSVVSLYGTGQRTPKLGALRRLAAALDRDWRSLVEDEEPNNSPGQPA